MSSILDGLDDVDWARLEHAYGSAADVPALLMDLASRDNERGERAINSFYGNIWHQGTVYEATSYAVPFLLRIAADKGNPLRVETLMLLASLAYGHSYHDVHKDLFFFEEERDTPDFQQQIRKELSWVEKAHIAVGEGVPLYLALLKDEEDKVRATATYLSSLFARSNAAVSPALWQRLAVEMEPVVRASLWLGIGLDRANAKRSELLEATNTAQSELEQWAICATLLRLLGVNAPAFASENIIATLENPSDELEEDYGEVPFNSEGLQADSAKLLLQLGKKGRVFRVPLCEVLLRSTNIWATMNLLETILPLFFGDFSRENPVTWVALDDEQREVFRAIVATDSVWGDGKAVLANMSQLVSYFGLLYNREKMRSLLPSSS